MANPNNRPKDPMKIFSLSGWIVGNWKDTEGECAEAKRMEVK
jgi:hypothetical protein